jgi:hypothetical protein
MSDIRSKMYIGLHVNYPLFLLEFNGTLNFLHRFSKNTQIQNAMEIILLGAEQPDIKKLVVTFRSLGEAPKKAFALSVVACLL